MRKLFGLFALTVFSSGGIYQSRPQLPTAYKTEIVLERNERDTWHAIDSRLVLDGGDRVRFRVRTNYSGYLYVTDRNTSGNYGMLFPGEETGSQNKLEPEHDYIVPANEGWFRIAGPPGQDVIYWLMSPIKLVALEQRKSQPQAELNKGPALVPRCDDFIFRARGDCVDTSAGVREVSDASSMPSDLDAIGDIKSRDLVFVRQRDTSIISSPAPLNEPVIYEFRLTHR